MSPQRITKGMVLCAGLGTRLLPITERTPKPLVPVLNVPNLVHTLFMLKRSGIEEVIVNVHHLPRPIEEFLGNGRRWGMRIAYSREEILLGTGGGLKKAESFFEGEPLVLANCDFITNMDLRPLIDQHCQRGALATMILLKDDKLQPLYSKVGQDAQGHLCSLPRLQTAPPREIGIFTGIHILENAVFRYLSETPCGINEVFYPSLMKVAPARVYAEFMKNGYWYDTGELDTFWCASMKLLERLVRDDASMKALLKTQGGYLEKRPGIWLPEDVPMPTGIELRAPVLIGQECHLGANSKIGPFAVLGDGTHVGEGASVSYFVGLGAARIGERRITEKVFQFRETLLPLRRTERDFEFPAPRP